VLTVVDLDDHSRTPLGFYALSELSGEQAYPCLAETFRATDSPSHTDGSRHIVVVGLERLGINAALGAADRARDSTAHGRVRHPQTQGKVERFHGTLGQAMRHRACRNSFISGQPRWPSFG